MKPGKLCTLSCVFTPLLTAADFRAPSLPGFADKTGRLFLMTDSFGHQKCGNMLNFSESTHSAAACHTWDLSRTIKGKKRRVCFAFYNCVKQANGPLTLNFKFLVILYLIYLRGRMFPITREGSFPQRLFFFSLHFLMRKG